MIFLSHHLIYLFAFVYSLFLISTISSLFHLPLCLSSCFHPPYDMCVRCDIANFMTKYRKDYSLLEYPCLYIHSVHSHTTIG